MTLFRVEHADRPRRIQFMEMDHFSPDVTSEPYPAGWYYYKPDSGVAYQLKLGMGEFWSIKPKEINFHFYAEGGPDEPDVEIRGKYEKMENGAARQTALTIECHGATTCFVPRKGLNIELTEKIKKQEVALAQVPEVRTLAHMYRSEDGTLYIVDLNMESLSINNLTGYLKTAQVMRAHNGELEFLEVQSYEIIKDTRDRLWRGDHYATRLANGDGLFEMHGTIEEFREERLPAPYLLSEGRRIPLQKVERHDEQAEALKQAGVSTHRYAFPRMRTPCHLLISQAAETK